MGPFRGFARVGWVGSTLWPSRRNKLNFVIHLMCFCYIRANTMFVILDLIVIFESSEQVVQLLEQDN